MYAFKYARSFKKDMKKISQSFTAILPVLRAVLETLKHGNTLDNRYRNHALHGEFLGSFECHITPDTLLIYKQEENSKIIHLLRIGSHAELFK